MFVFLTLYNRDRRKEVSVPGTVPTDQQVNEENANLQLLVA